jgi:hypothetical protein
MPLVAEKLLSILAFLGIHTLPRETNPVRQISACLVCNDFIPDDEDTILLDYFHGNRLDSRSCFLVLTFATRLVEQIHNAKLTQQGL